MNRLYGKQNKYEEKIKIKKYDASTVIAIVSVETNLGTSLQERRALTETRDVHILFGLTT